MHFRLVLKHTESGLEQQSLSMSGEEEEEEEQGV
jgi:hypothetical protein